MELLVAALVTAVSLPQGYDVARWGMTADDLKSKMKATQVDLSDAFGYADHLEEDPDVYIALTADHERLELYLFEGRLYKIYVVYDRVMTHTRLYEQLVERFTKEHGPPTRSYQDDYFGLPIQHTVWEDDRTTLDIRKGAGFVFQVRVDRATAEKKAKAVQKRKSI